MELGSCLDDLREIFKSGRTRSLAWRKAQLNAILDLVHENEEKILAALRQDLGKHPFEGYRDEVGVVVKNVDYCLREVEKWMAPTKASLPLPLFGSKGEVQAEPLGLVLIFSSWNFPFSLALDPLIGAICAGNTVVLKPSEAAPASSSFLAKTLPLYLDKKAIRVIEGGPELGDHLLKQKWDKIFFTGSSRVGRVVMSAAANHLTPVTLELGGKCPVIVDSLSSSNLQTSVKRIASAKWGPCAGQACIAVDYLIVEENLASYLIDLFVKTIKTFYGENMSKLRNISKIVNKHHFKRLRGLIEDPAVAASIVYGGSLDEEKLMFEPTILLNPPLDAGIMTEEIFGPFLPIITVNNIRESIQFLNCRPKPLAIYAFTKDESFRKQLISETSSGSITFNDTIVQYLCDELPFGGVGESGFGRYHGKYSFDTFSHEKTVFRGTFLPEYVQRYPPWNGFKLKFWRLGYRLDYIGLVLLFLGLKSYDPCKNF